MLGIRFGRKLQSGAQSLKGRGNMKVGLFDHVELSDRAYATTLDERLTFAQAADEAGIWCLHVAEHHASPLNMVPVPGVYLGARRAADEAAAHGAAGLSAAALFAAAAGGRNLHARSHEQGAAGSGRRARRVAVRTRLPQDQARGLARHLQGRLRVPARRADERSVHVRERALLLQGRADGAASAAAADARVLVRFIERDGLAMGGRGRPAFRHQRPDSAREGEHRCLL